jgi:hypothetical protein
MKRLIRKILSFFDGKPRFDVDEQHKIIPAFVWNGIQYYQFEDINNMMTGRAFTCLDYYNELSMRCTREYLTEHTETCEKLLNEGKLVDVAQLNIQLKERLTMIIDPDIVYKIASAVYFDADEQPYTYDFRYNQKKINGWKQSGIDGFFLKLPLRDLIPSLDLSEVDLKAYMKVAQTINKKHLENISTLKSGKTKKAE